MLNDMLALANSVCLLALSRSGRRVLALLLCTGLIAPYCAVCGIGARRLRARTCGKNLDENKSLGKEGSYSINKRERKKKEKGSPACNRTCCSNGGSETPERCQSSLLWKKTKIRKSIPTRHTFFNSFGRAAKAK